MRVPERVISLENNTQYKENREQKKENGNRPTKKLKILFLTFKRLTFFPHFCIL
jgi:hypothetical protein